jgi:tetratricopeptide (TPR) repeat protein
MARTILAVLLIVLSTVLTGCHGVDSGKSQLLPPPPVKEVPIVEAGEADIIEQMAINRSAYRQYLESLIAHYKKTGNSMKLGWAENELKRLNEMPQYNYVIEASVAGPDLKAIDSIAIADYMYDEAYRLEKKSKFLFITHEDNLREALYKYNQLIRKHPSSDKIDDAAYRAAGIYEYFMDYTLAVLYYQRTYQWDPDTPYPARFKAAYILDEHLHRRAEALKLYQKALENEDLTPDDKEFVGRRIAALTKSWGGESLEENK